jgi:hypothetical protein
MDFNLFAGYLGLSEIKLTKQFEATNMSLINQIFSETTQSRNVLQNFTQQHDLEFLPPVMSGVVGVFIGLAIGSFLGWC